MRTSVSKVDTFLSLRDGFERFAGKTDEIVRTLEIELRHLLEEWSERVQKARQHERRCQNDLSDAQRDLRWAQGRRTDGNSPDCSYEQARLEKARRSLAEAELHLELICRSAREVQIACEAFQKHGRALRQMATQTAPNASSHMNLLLRDLERSSFVAPSGGSSSGTIGGAAMSAPPSDAPHQEHSSIPSNEVSDAAYQAKRSSSLRELASLLRGEYSPTSPTDTTQVRRAGQKLGTISELAPKLWENLDEQQRVTVLGSIECIMAKLQGRPAVPVFVEETDSNSYGGYDPQTNCISLSRCFVNQANSREITEIIIHEGRHAYQEYTMQQPAFHSDQEEVGRWRINNLYYLRAEIWGDEAYRNQPIERDAFTYAKAVMQQMAGETR